ncbi:MAG: hypothetical protein M5U01_38625 [Ardenticatenaceae bacterium]|nr:hypothetical protein [Ardenticatenaceae bacterium]HBY96144.1 hypothetical protein [Chloroflexota bacterium]
MTALTAARLRRWGRVRRVAFFVWAAILSLLFGITFIGVTVLTVGIWLVNQNPYTNPVTDLGFFALGAIIITAGLVVQLRAPEHKIAGVQQAVIGLLALGVAGLIGGRVEPLTGSLLFLVATAILVALHPARREFFKVGKRLSAPLAALSILAAIPATAYAATMLVQARQAGPSCFFGRCAYGDRFAEMAALAIAIVVLGMLAASQTEGWRVTAWSVGAAAAIFGSASIVLPEVSGAPGQAAGALAVAWGVLFVAVAEREKRNTSEPPGPETRGQS